MLLRRLKLGETESLVFLTTVYLQDVARMLAMRKGVITDSEIDASTKLTNLYATDKIMPIFDGLQFFTTSGSHDGL